MKIKFLVTVLVTFLSIVGQAQKFELGDVTIQELKEKVHPRDSSAVAAILFKKGEVYFEYSQTEGFEMVTVVKTKIKIYKREGYDWANQIIPYFTGGNSKEKLNIKNACTFNLVNNKIEKTKLKKEGEFTEKINNDWSQKKITMPNVKEGSIIEFEYLLRSDYLNTIDEWEFQSSIPVNHVIYTTRIPEFFVYQPSLRGHLVPVNSVEKTSKSVSLVTKERSDDRVTQTSFYTDVVNYEETKTTYTLNNVIALRDEAFVSNIRNYMSAISHELKMTKFPNQPIRSFSSDWESVVRMIYNNGLASELGQRSYFEEDLKAVISALPRNEKIMAVYHFVKSRMKWNGNYGYNPDKGVKSSYKEGLGNVADINLMLVAMLRYAGFESNPVLLTTRSKVMSIFPNTSSFNYVIAAVEIENDLILLDATDKYALPNILPIRDLNWYGRIIREGGSSASVNLMPKFMSKEMVNMMASIDAQGKVTGKIRDQYFDYSAFVFRGQYGGLSKDSYLEKLENTYKGIEVDGYEVLNVKEITAPVVENYSFSSMNEIEIIGDKMYFSPMMFFKWNKNPFIQEKREYPVDFIFPNQRKYTIIISLPEGYAVDYTPSPKAVSMPDEIAMFKYNIQKSDKQIQLMVSMDINTSMVSSEYYEALKKFFDEVVKAETDRVILKKV